MAGRHKLPKDGPSGILVFVCWLVGHKDALAVKFGRLFFVCVRCGRERE